jgi:hypothetical protein
MARLLEHGHLPSCPRCGVADGVNEEHPLGEARWFACRGCSHVWCEPLDDATDRRHAMAATQIWSDQQFDIQLELEDLDADQLRERARSAATHGLTRDETINVSIWILASLVWSPVLTDDEQHARFDAWCDGLGFTSEEMFRELGDRLLKNIDADRRRKGEPLHALPDTVTSTLRPN